MRVLDADDVSHEICLPEWITFPVSAVLSGVAAGSGKVCALLPPTFTTLLLGPRTLAHPIALAHLSFPSPTDDHTFP